MQVPVSARRATIAEPLLYAITIAAIYAYSWPLVTGDMHVFLVPWYQHIVDNGTIGAFARPFANYTPPYLYLLSVAAMLDGLLPAITLIKVLSVLGAVALGGSVTYLLAALGVRSAVKGGCAILLLPTVIFNAPMLGQADVFWTAACVVAIAEAVKQRHASMLFWCGVAFAFKAQAIFIAPFVLAVLIQRRVPFSIWPIPALIYAGAMLPAWLAGWPAGDLLTVYLRQVEWGPDFVSNASNIWSIAGYVTALPLQPWLWLGFCAAALSVIAYLILVVPRRLSAETILAAALLSSAMLPFLLPKMHERFFFLADILAFAIAWAIRTRTAIALAVLMQASSLASALGVLGWAPGAAVGGVFTIATLILTSRLIERGDRERVPANVDPIPA